MHANLHDSHERQEVPKKSVVKHKKKLTVSVHARCSILTAFPSTASPNGLILNTIMVYVILPCKQNYHQTSKRPFHISIHHDTLISFVRPSIFSSVLLFVHTKFYTNTLKSVFTEGWRPHIAYKLSRNISRPYTRPMCRCTVVQRSDPTKALVVRS